MRRVYTSIVGADLFAVVRAIYQSRPIADRYATTIILAPTVAILGGGEIRDAGIAVNGKAEVRRMLPRSLTFDHRALTGGEAARFLAAVLSDLQLRD